MRLLDRYVLRNFLEPFLICFFGFIAIWLIFDLYDNSHDFLEYHVRLKNIAIFYLAQLPAVILLSVPVALLLALLFSLSKMSRHNEIISMLTAGRSVYRVLLPLVIIGILASAGCMVLNWEWAPHAEASKATFMERFRKGDRGDTRIVEGYLFRNRLNNRTWYVRRFQPLAVQLDGVHITEQDAEGNTLAKWYAARAVYNPDKSWTLNRGMHVTFNKAGDIVENDSFATPADDKKALGYRTVKNWSETPWRIAAGQFQAQNLSVEELRDYLKFNSDFPEVQLASFRTNLADRYAFPLSCLVVIFIAAPLGIVYSRRGVLAGVAGSIFIFFAMIMIRYFFLAMGKGSHMKPNMAAWLPDVAFMFIGLVLLYFRSSNREFKLAFWK